jgi:hypothetical protein
MGGFIVSLVFWSLGLTPGQPFSRSAVQPFSRSAVQPFSRSAVQPFSRMRQNCYQLALISYQYLR